jgi:nitrite reductase (NADH) large subunit
MRLVIVGNGVAGINTVLTVSKNRPDADITVYSEERYLYYPRPKLWDFLSGKISLEQLYFYPQSWYDERGIKVHLGRSVKEIKPGDKTVTLDNGQSAPYDCLLLATGSLASVPPIENVKCPGVFTLRSVDDALAIRKYAGGARAAVVIGGGLLGLESARGLKDLGLEVTVVEFFPWLLPKQLDQQGAVVLNKKFEGMGIQVVTGAASQAIEGDGRATGVLLKDGRHLPGELVLISTGVRCHTALAVAAGLKVNRGVIVDEHLRTDGPDIYAVGDVAEFDGRSYGIIPAAIEQARIAGANIAGQVNEAYRGTVPSNTLKVVGVDLTTVGTFNAPNESYQEHRFLDPDKGIYRKFVVNENRIVGAILLGVPKEVVSTLKLIREAQPLSVPIESLLNPA